MIRKLLFLPFFCVTLALQAQYAETFDIPNKGYLLNHENDFSQVSWSLSTWELQPPAEFGRDVTDYFATAPGGLLECLDLDQEVCWLSPDLTVFSTGTVTYSADLVWVGFDAGQTMPLEFINVEYQLNGGNWVRHPNVLGANGDPAYTVKYENIAGSHNGSAQTLFPAIAVTAGDVMNLQICVSTNANAEIVTIDNVTVSGVSKVLPLAGPDLNLKLLPNPFSDVVNVGWEMPKTGKVIIEVLDAQGKLVFAKHFGELSGTQSWSWQGVDNQDSSVPPGVYTLVLRGETWQKAVKLVRA
jgi:FlgD Ig-like domain